MSWTENIFKDKNLEILVIISILLGCTYVLIKAIPKIPVLRKLTSVPFLFLVPMFLSNLSIIPVDYPLFNPLQDFVLYLAIFFMVSNIDIKEIIRSLQPRLFLLFFLACLGTAFGGMIAYIFFSPIIGAENSAMVAAATTAIFTGGAMNWVAVASALQMPGTLSATAFPATIIIFTIYLTFIVSLKRGKPGEKLSKWLGDKPATKIINPQLLVNEDRTKGIQFDDFVKGFFYFTVTYVVSIIISKQLASYIFIPEVLLITTLALVLGHVVKLKYLKGTSAFGEACLYFLLTIIGAQGNIVEALSNAPILILFPGIVLSVHILVTLFVAKLLKTDLTTTSITSIAAIGGSASAPIVAAVYDSKELIPVAIILGSLGYAVGNYLGIYLGFILLGSS